MADELEPISTARPAPLEQVKRSVHSDLQYVSLQLDGATYGGWYRVLTDGQMELLALANMHCERRFENTPIEQARGMLADFIRSARPKANGSDAGNGKNGLNGHADGNSRAGTPGTLGDLLYADKAKTRVSEKDWVGLVHCIAAGDQLALHELYERTHRLVFTLMMRLTHDQPTAEGLTLDVFHDVWRRASGYDAADESVVGWIMNQARSRAIARLEFERRKEQVNPHAGPDVLQPSEALRERLARRIAAETGGEPLLPTIRQWAEPEWEEVAPGISCKLLATDSRKNRVSMLVRLAPGVDYPAHTHAGVEELHLLHGKLLIDARELYPGDYNRAEPCSSDKRVWSETGCSCVLITSTQDIID